MFHPFLIALTLDLSSLLGQPQSWAVLISLATPGLISVINQPGFSRGKRQLVAAAVSLVVGVVTVASSGQFNTADLLSTCAVVLVASQAAYHKLWKPRGAAARVEAVTTVRRRRA